MTYPHYLHLLDQLQPDVSLYYNIDDYTRYWPRHAVQIRELECKLVSRATATVCVARFRADELRGRSRGVLNNPPYSSRHSGLVPGQASRLPPGVRPADIAHLPRPLLGYVGSIEDRVDWQLMKKLSAAFSGASIVIVGRSPHASRHREPWFRDWVEFSAGRNVHEIGWRPQESLPRYVRIIRRDPDAICARSSFQHGLLSDEDHGRHGIGSADRGDVDSRVPPVRASL